MINAQSLTMDPGHEQPIIDVKFASPIALELILGACAQCRCLAWGWGYDAYIIC